MNCDHGESGDKTDLKKKRYSG